MRVISAVSLAVLASATLAFAQDEPPVATAADPSLDALSSSSAPADATDAEGEPESELDALSRNADDPFPEMETQKKRKPVSVTLRALDKITARYTDIEAPIGETVKFGSLEILPRYCDKRPPEEFPETTAFLEIYDRSRDNAEPTYKDPKLAAEMAAAEAAKKEAAENLKEATSSDNYSVEASVPKSEFSLDAGAPDDDAPTDERLSAPAPAETTQPSRPVDPDRIFEGWMFASTPALNALEHPVYDVWVIDCKTVPVDK